MTWIRALALCLVPAALAPQAEESTFDSATVQQVDGASCYRYPRYTVVARERPDEVGSDIIVHDGPSAPCTLDSLAGDVVFHNEWAEYFIGLIGNNLVLRQRDWTRPAGTDCHRPHQWSSRLRGVMCWAVQPLKVSEQG